MKIMVNTSLLKHKEGYIHFTADLLKRIVSQNREHEFIIIADDPIVKEFSFGNNVTEIIRVRLPQHPLLRRFWYNWKLPSILKKYNADVFVSVDGFCSLRSGIPQCLLILETSFLNNSSSGVTGKDFFFRRYLPGFLQKAAGLVTVSNALKQDLVLRYKIAEQKIDVLYPVARDIFLRFPKMPKRK